MMDEFRAQRDPEGPVIGAVTHKSAAQRGLLLRGLDDPVGSKIDVAAEVTAWLNMPRESSAPGVLQIIVLKMTMWPWVSRKLAP